MSNRAASKIVIRIRFLRPPRQSQELPGAVNLLFASKTCAIDRAPLGVAKLLAKQLPMHRAAADVAAFCGHANYTVKVIPAGLGRIMRILRPEWREAA